MINIEVGDYVMIATNQKLCLAVECFDINGNPQGNIVGFYTFPMSDVIQEPTE